MVDISSSHSDNDSHPPPSDNRLEIVQQGEIYGGPDFKPLFIKLVLTDGQTFFYHEHPSPELPEDMSGIYEKARIIPQHFYQVISPPELIPAPLPLLDDSYIKTYSLLGFNPKKEERTFVASVIIKEARIYERLLQNPHPNICKYCGYVQKDGWMTGLCLKKYPKTLGQAIKDGDKIDPKVIIDGIASGLEHLHSMGLVHNDINPKNIMLTSHSKPVIIDFDSCEELGARIEGKAGTFEWTNDAEYSEKENDYYGLRKIEAWLSEKILDEAVLAL